MTPAPGPTPDQLRALRNLVHDGTLDDHQAAAVQGALWAPTTQRPAASPLSTVIEAAGYVGGGLILGGALLLVTINITALGKQNAVLLLAAMAAILIVAAVLIAGGPARLVRVRDRRVPIRARLVSVLLAVSAGPAAMAGALASGTRPAQVAGLVGLAVAVAGYALAPAIPGVLAMAIMSSIAVIGTTTLGSTGPLPTTFGLFGLGLVWSVASAAGLVRPRHIGFTVAATLGIVGAQVARTYGDDSTAWSYGLTFLVALGCFVVYWLDRATALLAFGVVAATIAVPEGVSDWTNGALSGPGILVVSGTVLVGASALSLWLRSLRSSRNALPPTVLS